MRTHGKLKLGVAAGLATFVAVGASRAVLGQEADLHGFRAACAPDYRQYCAGDNPGVTLEAACLSQYYINLSLSCRMALDRLQNPSAADEGQSGSSDESNP